MWPLAEWMGLSEADTVIWTALFAAVIAVWGIFSQRVIASRQATVALVQKSLSDKDLLDARKTFIEEARKPQGLATWADPQHDGSKESLAILTVLNEYELTAIAIQSGIVDLKLYCRWNRSTAISDWRHAAPFVFALRNRHDRATLFIEYEDLVAEMGGRKRTRRNYFWSKIF